MTCLAISYRRNKIKNAGNLRLLPCLIALLVVLVFNDEDHVKSRQDRRLEINVLNLTSAIDCGASVTFTPRQDYVLHHSDQRQDLPQQGHLFASSELS